MTKWLSVPREKLELIIDVRDIITGAQPKAGTGLKMQTVRFFNVTVLGIYRWLRYIAGSLKSYPPFWKERGMEDSQEKDYSFLGHVPQPLRCTSLWAKI